MQGFYPVHKEDNILIEHAVNIIIYGLALVEDNILIEQSIYLVLLYNMAITNFIISLAVHDAYSYMQWRCILCICMVHVYIYFEKTIDHYIDWKKNCQKEQ